MSISTYEPRSDYIGTGNQSSYTFNFTVKDEAEILICKYDDEGTLVWKVSGDDLTVLLSVTINDDGGGTIVLVDDLETDYVLAIIQNANEPVFTKNFSRNTHWDLKQLQSAYEQLTYQLQSVAYLARRAPRLGNNVAQVDADNFDMDLELIPEAVIAINADGDGFTTLAKETFIGPEGPQGDPGPTGAQGAPGAGVLFSDVVDIANGADEVDITFSGTAPDTTYRVGVMFWNYVDTAPFLMFPQAMGIDRTTAGFKLKLSAPVNTANYKVEYTVNATV